MNVIFSIEILPLVILADYISMKQTKHQIRIKGTLSENFRISFLKIEQKDMHLNHLFYVVVGKQCCTENT